MAEQLPTFVDDLCYPANDLRLMQGGLIIGEGVQGGSALRVSESDPPSGDIRVDAGHAFIDNDNAVVTGGVYHIYNDGEVLLTVPLNSTGSDRTDVVWAQICDSEYAAVTSGFTLLYDADNPTETAPADGCTYYQLATLVIPNGAGTGGANVTGDPNGFGDTNGMITDTRNAYQPGGDFGWVQDSAVLNFPSIGAGLAQTLPMTVNGASVGDPVAVGCTIGAFSSQLIWSAYVSAPDTVTCRVFNPTGGALDPPSSTWTVAVKVG